MLKFLQIGWTGHNFLWTLSCGWWERINDCWQKTKDIPIPVKECLKNNLDLCE